MFMHLPISSARIHKSYKAQYFTSGIQHVVLTPTNHRSPGLVPIHLGFSTQHVFFFRTSVTLHFSSHFLSGHIILHSIYFFPVHPTFFFDLISLRELNSFFGTCVGAFLVIATVNSGIRKNPLSLC